MKFKNLFLFAAIAITVSCGKYQFDASQVSKEVAQQQAKNQLGIDIDPNQNWRPIRNGSVTITANADMENIVRVEILTESPFDNEDALVLNSVECQAGQQVTLTYEAPDYLTQLMAACVNDKGVYYVKVFDIDSQAVDFKTSSARTRASEGGFPNTIVLGKGTKSFNAQRAEASVGNKYGIQINDAKGKARWYTAWKDGSWANDMLWEHKSVEGEGGWYMHNKNKTVICRDITDQGDLATLKVNIETYLKKYANGTSGAKANNWKNTISTNPNFTINNNELVSDGKPLIIIPIQMNTTEGGNNSVYYYYYNPATAPTDKAALANYIKGLPKYKALWGYYDSNFKREKEYLLPYYGDEIPVEGTWGSPVIPKGYKIGFLNCKNKGNSIYSNSCGCVYGVGDLNVEVNHLIGHFNSAISNSIAQDVISNENGDTEKIYGGSANGMEWDSPRIAIFNANNRSYLCFEDGADLNFCDMIVEIKQGTNIILETIAPEVEPAMYTMCFEDRAETADYDMNDVVLTAKRKNATQIILTLAACGAKDKVVLRGIEGSKILNNGEIHDLLGLTDENAFANTQIGGYSCKGKSETITIGNKTIVDFLSEIYIENLTTGKTVSMPGKGEPPYAIIVPMRFNYPKEGSSIKKAYPEFLIWAQSAGSSKDWYRSLEGVDRYPTLFMK